MSSSGIDRIKSSIRCFNCGQAHNVLRDLNEMNCYLITIKRSGRTKIGVFDQVQSIVIPRSIGGRQKLREFIWKEFESIKVEIDNHREALAAQKVPKGQLRIKAPIPWLCWTAVDGEKGQTRSKTNFYLVWERTIESLAQREPFLLTSVFLPSHQTDAIIAEKVNKEQIRI